MSAYEAFRIYNGLKLHFTTESYNYFKYHGKTKVKVIPQNQFFVYERLGKRYEQNLEEFFLANFLEDPKIWINDLLSEESDHIYKLYQKKMESLAYSFKNDIVNLFEETENLNDLFLVKTDFPILLKKTMQNKINLETLLIMDSILNFFSVWNNNIKEDIIWKNFQLKCIKYFPFIKFDRNKMKEILKMEVMKYAK